jgi:hypothetical protein
MAMRHTKTRKRLVALAALAVGLLAIPSAWAWTVTMDATPALKRTYGWTIEKSVSQSSLTLKAGESANVTYTVKVSAGAPVDSDWSVSGLMEMTDDPNITVNSVVFRVIPEAPVNTPEILASHSCMPMTFPVDLGIIGLTCTYSASLPDASDRRAWMRATATEDDGTTGVRNVFAPFSFDTATVNEVDECVNVTDSMAGALGMVCAADAPKTFTYSTTIGPFGTDECGDHTVDNTASFLTNDTGASGSASASVDVSVVCEPPKNGCTRTIGYWKNHAGFGPQADVVTPLLPVWLGTAGGAKSVNVTTASLAVQLLSMRGTNNVHAASNGINKLYAQLLAAKLNGEANADTSSVDATMAAADAFLASNNTLSWSGLSAAQKATVNSWMSKLDSYNNGNEGTEHCD